MMSIEIIDSSDDDLSLLAVAAIKHIDHVKGKRGKPRKVRSSTDIDKQQPCKERRLRGRQRKSITDFSESRVNNSQSPINYNQSPASRSSSTVSLSCWDRMPDDQNIVKESELTRYAVKVCEICKETFYNQLQIVMHNISHLTVKLEMLPFCKCPYCSATLLTQDLARHKKTCAALTKENILSDFKNVERTTNTTEPTKPLKQSKGFNLSNNIVFEDSDIIVNDCIDLDYSLLKPVETVKDETVEKECISMHLQNLVNECNVDLNINNKMQGRNGEGGGNGMLPDTVPFNELIKKEINPCKYCLKSFDSRYELCRHEQKHLKLRDCFVPFCIACGLRTVRLYSHAMCRPCFNDPNLVQFYSSFVRCEHCENVFYDETSLVMHRKTAHNTETYQLAVKRPVEFVETSKDNVEDSVLKFKTVPQKTTNTSKKKGKFKSTVITTCEMCHLLGSKTNYANGRHIFLADVEKPRLTSCAKCGGKFRSMKVVKVVWWSAKRARKVKDKDFKSLAPKSPSYVSALSNVDRLLNIQQRFKKMRKGLL